MSRAGWPSTSSSFRLGLAYVGSREHHRAGGGHTKSGVDSVRSRRVGLVPERALSGGQHPDGRKACQWLASCGPNRGAGTIRVQQSAGRKRSAGDSRAGRLLEQCQRCDHRLHRRGTFRYVRQSKSRLLAAVPFPESQNGIQLAPDGSIGISAV